MGRLSLYARERIVNMRSRGLTYQEIVRRLDEEDDICTSRQAVALCYKTYQDTGKLTPRHGGGNPSILKEEHATFIDEETRKNPELTGLELQKMVEETFGITASVDTILRCRRKLGWLVGKTKFGPMVSDKNKPLRMTFAESCLESRDRFEDVVFVDESIIKMVSHSRRQCYKRGEPIAKRLRPVAKHPYQVNVWAGISVRGATPIAIFEGDMNADFYQEVLRRNLVPWLEKTYPEGCRFWQDNDPKHSAKSSVEFYSVENINWWKTPAQSPDMNPIENVWAQLKHYVNKVAKPLKKEDHIQAIKTFWETKVTPQLCQRYISHLKKVLPAVVEVEGRASGY